jgi:O-antigen/teichoic acid export membrane protein
VNSRILILAAVLAALPLIGNIILSGLINGWHNITGYAMSTFENAGTAKTIDFTVDAPFPTAWFVVAIVLSIAGGFLFAVYWFTKRRRIKDRSRQER